MRRAGRCPHDETSRSPGHEDGGEPEQVGKDTQWLVFTLTFVSRFYAPTRRYLRKNCVDLLRESQAGFSISGTRGDEKWFIYVDAVVLAPQLMIRTRQHGRSSVVYTETLEHTIKYGEALEESPRSVTIASVNDSRAPDRFGASEDKIGGSPATPSIIVTRI